METHVCDAITLVGNSDREVETSGAGLTGAKQLSGTIKEVMEDFMRSDAAKKRGFTILSIAQSQSYNPRKNVADVTITVAFSFIGEESERPSQKFDRARIEGDTGKFPSKPPMVRQPEVPPHRISGVPQVRLTPQ